MRRRLSLVVSIAACLAAGPAHAGFPIEMTLECPLDDEVVRMTSTPSCSSMGQRLNGRPISSCDFVDVLPDCRRSRVPLYTEFAPEDVERLRALVDGEAFAAVRDRSRFERTVWLEERLGLVEDFDAAWVLAQGVYEDPELLSDADYAGRLLAATRARADAGFDPDAPTADVWAAYRFAALHTFHGDAGTANVWLDRARDLRRRRRSDVADALERMEASGEEAGYGLRSAERGLDFAKRWDSLLRQCLAKPGAAACDPNSKV